MNTETTNNMDKFLKWLQWFAFVAIVVAATIITFYFIYTWGPISSNQNDWASLGTLLSGVFSFLGAIGTVGVMFLGIKQFKIQQTQIKKQYTVLDAQEKRANFDLYQNHLSSFKLFLTELENELKTIHFINKNQLYKKIFPNNTEKQLSFTQTKSEFLTIQTQCFNEMIENCKTVDSYEDIERVIGGLISLNYGLLIECEQENLIGDISYIFNDTNHKPLGANVHLIDQYTYKIMTILERLASFADVRVHVSPRITYLEDNSSLLEYALKNITEEYRSGLKRIKITNDDFYEDCLKFLIEVQKYHKEPLNLAKRDLIDKQSFIERLAELKEFSDISKSPNIDTLYQQIEKHLESPVSKFLALRSTRKGKG